MRSIIAERGHSTPTAPAEGAHLRLERVATATCEQMKTALTFLSAFSPDAFDYAMDAAESGDDDPCATEEAEPVCAICGSSIGVFLGLGLDWQHFTGDGTTVGEQQIHDPGHVPVVTWHLAEELRSLPARDQISESLSKSWPRSSPS